jgi:O-antigen/teichoic acid export membrane protein
MLDGVPTRSRSQPDVGRDGIPAAPTPPADRASRHWAILALRQLVMSAGTLAAGLYLALVLPPAEFAVFGYATTVFLVATAAGDLGLGAAIVREGPTRWRLERSLGLVLAVWLAASAILVVLTLVAAPTAPSQGEVLLLVAALGLMSIQMIPTALLEQRLDFGAIAILEASQRGLFVAIACGGALVWESGAPIAVGAAISALGGGVATFAAARWRWWPRFSGSRAAVRGFASAWWLGRLASQANYASYIVVGTMLFTEGEVGLMVWALAITSVPTILAPLASRVLLPNLVLSPGAHGAEEFRRLSTLLTFISLPLVAVIFVCADQLPQVFGDQWEDGVVLVRLECVTTVLGVAITPSIALLFLALDARRVAGVMILWAASSYVLAIGLATWLDYRAPSVAQIVTGSVALVVLDRLLQRETAVSLVRTVLPGAATLVLVAVPGALLATRLDGTAAPVALAFGVASAQVLGMARLYRRSIIRDAATLARRFAATARTVL